MKKNTIASRNRNLETIPAWEREIWSLADDFQLSERDCKALSGIIRDVKKAHKGADGDTLYNATWRGLWDLIDKHLGAA